MIKSRLFIDFRFKQSSSIIVIPIETTWVCIGYVLQNILLLIGIICHISKGLLLLLLLLLIKSINSCSVLLLHLGLHHLLNMGRYQELLGNHWLLRCHLNIALNSSGIWIRSEHWILLKMRVHVAAILLLYWLSLRQVGVGLRFKLLLICFLGIISLMINLLLWFLNWLLLIEIQVD